MTSLFANELKKLIETEVERLRHVLETGNSIVSYEKYREVVGELAGLRRVSNFYLDEVEDVLKKR